MVPGGFTLGRVLRRRRVSSPPQAPKTAGSRGRHTWSGSPADLGAQTSAAARMNRPPAPACYQRPPILKVGGERGTVEQRSRAVEDSKRADMASDLLWVLPDRPTTTN